MLLSGHTGEKIKCVTLKNDTGWETDRLVYRARPSDILRALA